MKSNGKINLFQKTVALTNKTTRKGIPDSRRREIILSYFGLKPEKCKLAFNAVLETTQSEEIEIAQEDKPSTPFICLHYLNLNGLKSLELIVHLINKEKHIEYSPILINFISLLLLYLPIEEAYCVTQKMIK